MKRLFAAVVALLATTAGWAQLPTYLDDTKPIEARVQDALSRMTLAEKVALCHAQGKFCSAGVPRLGIPELWMSDGPHGVREEIQWDAWNNAGWTSDSCTAFPALTCLAATWNPRMAAIYGKAVGEEARYREKDILLGPGVNIYRTPLCGRNFEYMGEDPYLSSKMVVPYIQELQKNGVAACVKHYALNNQELWRGHIDVEVSDRALHEIYLPAFSAAIKEGGAWSIMGAYNKFRGAHACNNEILLQNILKRDWNFDGVVITDWGGCHSTKESALNGLDIEMGSYTNGLTSESKFTYNDYYLAKPYLKMLKEGALPVSNVDEKATRILRLIFRTAMNRQKPFGSLASDEHHAVCRTIADEGIVLLKNTPVQKKQPALLPIDASKYKKILVVGENATRKQTHGGGSSELKAKHEISPLEGLRAIYGDKITYAQGYKGGRPMFGSAEQISANDLKQLREEAVTAAKEADLVIFVGGLNKNFQQDSEAGDRTSYNLPYEQSALIEELLAVNPKTIVTIISGNAVAMPWKDKVSAIVQGWYIGSETGTALADILSGTVNPSGKLPFSIAAKLNDWGSHSFGTTAYPGDSIKVIYKEDILVGYRWLNTKGITPSFAFGHGLSYTSFKYGKPMLSSSSMDKSGNITISVPVKNIGTRSGKEVVQLYINDEECSVLRPAKELKGFEKIELAPGEERTVTFTITPQALSFFDEAKHDWTCEPGTFKALVGSSSADIRGTAEFTLK